MSLSYTMVFDLCGNLFEVSFEYTEESRVAQDSPCKVCDNFNLVLDGTEPVFTHSRKITKITSIKDECGVSIWGRSKKAQELLSSLREDYSIVGPVCEYCSQIY